MSFLKWGGLDLGQRWREAQDAMQRRAREEALARDKLAIQVLAKNVAPSVPSAIDRLDAALRAGDLVGVKTELDAGVSPDVQLRGPIPTDGTMTGTPDALDGPSGWFLIPNIGNIPRNRSKVGYTPLIWAMATANLALADLLLAAGAHPLAPNNERRTPLSVAAKAGSPKALIWIAAHVNQRDWTREDGDLSARSYVEHHDPVLAEALDEVVKPTPKPVARRVATERATEAGTVVPPADPLAPTVAVAAVTPPAEPTSNA